MTISRGNRPKQPARWPRTQEARRFEAEQIGPEIVALTREVRAKLRGMEDTTNQYLQQVYRAQADAALSDIAALGERIARLMVEAKIGEDSEPKEEE